MPIDYNDPEYADSLIDKEIHLCATCPVLDVKGKLLRITKVGEETLYVLDIGDGKIIYVGANHPGLSIISENEAK